MNRPCYKLLKAIITCCEDVKKFIAILSNRYHKIPRELLLVFRRIFEGFGSGQLYVDKSFPGNKEIYKFI